MMTLEDHPPDDDYTTNTDLLVLSGGSGVGKTTFLALSLEPFVVQDQVFFVQAKLLS
jgi:guanylate kinase